MQTSIRLFLLLSLLVIIQYVSSPYSTAMGAPIPTANIVTKRTLMESLSSLSSMPILISRDLDLTSPVQNTEFVDRALQKASNIIKRWNFELGFAQEGGKEKVGKSKHTIHKAGPPSSIQ